MCTARTSRAPPGEVGWLEALDRAHARQHRAQRELGKPLDERASDTAVGASD